MSDNQREAGTIILDPTHASFAPEETVHDLGATHFIGIGGAGMSVLAGMLHVQGVEVDEVRVARKGRAALIGAVPITGGAQRQDLPDLLARCGQKIHERFRFRSEAANSIGAGQAGHRH